MATLSIRITHVSWRDGKPRFQPSPQARAEGWKGENLRHGPEVFRVGHPPKKTGPWFTADECLAWVKVREQEIDRRRQDIADARMRGARVGKLKVGTAPSYSVEDLFTDWMSSPRMSDGETVGKRKAKTVSANTLDDYNSKRRTLAVFDPEIYIAPVNALTQPIVYDLYERLWQARGLATARGVIATLSSAISWGMRKGKVRLAVNPCKSLGMETPKPRLRCLSPAEVKALVAAADLTGRPEIGDSVILGCWTGQRQCDRLVMIDGGAVDGRRLLRQSKTNAVVMIPDAPEVKKRLTAMRRRRKIWAVSPMEIIVDEQHRRPWLRSHYNHTFAAVRAAAVAGIRDATSGAWLLEPTPGLADARDQDLRDTAVTWLARATCTLPEICAITGHSLESAHQVLKHYLASHPELADNAIKKLVAWMDGQG